MTELDIDLEELHQILAPFKRAIDNGKATRAAVEAADLRGKRISNLIGIASYAGQHAIESHLSWNAYMRLADLIDALPDLEPVECLACGKDCGGACDRRYDEGREDR